MKIVIGSEKAGFALKTAIKRHLLEQGHEVYDVGPAEGKELVSYVEIAHQAANMVASGDAERGVLICGTGMGMSLAANKHRGVYAAVVESEYSARNCRLINNANVLCLGAFLFGERLAIDTVDTFLNTGFMTDFAQWRVDFLESQRKAMLTLEEKAFR